MFTLTAKKSQPVCQRLLPVIVMGRVTPTDVDHDRCCFRRFNLARLAGHRAIVARRKPL